MATEYLIPGATTFAASSFIIASGAGGSGFVNGATLVVSDGTQAIVSTLDWSALTEGINYLSIGADFGGTIGTSSTPLRVDVDADTSGTSNTNLWTSNASGPARLSHNGTNTLYLHAGGDNSLIVNLMQSGTGQTIMSGSGTITYANVTNGNFVVNSGTVVTNLYQTGGRSSLDTTTNLVTLVEVWGGNTICKRVPTSMVIHGGTVTLDTGSTVAATAVTVHGGTLIHRSGSITTLTLNSGTYDPTGLGRDATIGTAVRRGACKVVGRPTGATLTVTTDSRLEPDMRPI